MTERYPIGKDILRASVLIALYQPGIHYRKTCLFLTSNCSLSEISPNFIHYKWFTNCYRLYTKQKLFIQSNDLWKFTKHTYINIEWKFDKLLIKQTHESWDEKKRCCCSHSASAANTHGVWHQRFPIINYCNINAGIRDQQTHTWLVWNDMI